MNRRRAFYANVSRGTPPPSCPRRIVWSEHPDTVCPGAVTSRQRFIDERVSWTSSSGGREVMKVAIFTDNDFGKVNGVTTTLRAVLDHAPDDLDLRIYTCARLGIDSPEYL